MKRLRIRLSAKAEAKVRGGHPWVFSDSIREENRSGEAGELAVIYDRKDRFLAVGFYDPESPIRVRVVHCGKPEVIGDSWWREKFTESLSKRSGVMQAGVTDGVRLINGESDGWPGAVLDRYGDTLVWKIYSVVWEGMVGLLGELASAVDGCERCVLRRSRNLGGKEVEVIAGSAPGGAVVFMENGLRYEAEVMRGQKTGFFLDQRDNRARVRDLAAGRSVLNVFSFSGAFSVSAAAGGATSVTDVDISQHALDSGRRNFVLNRGDVGHCPRNEVKADAFAWLKETGGSYGVVIVDPPSMAKREKEREGAMRAYGRLARAAKRVTAPGGVLVMASCSGHVRADEFGELVKKEIGGEVFGEWGHAADHRATFPEANYLKAVYFRVAR